MTFLTEIEPSQERPTLAVPHLRLPIHDALSLTNGGSLAQIALNGQTYTLRITRAGKLILTK